MKIVTTQKKSKTKRIAVWIFYDLILPVQRGKPGDKEREESNKEIEETLKKSKYHPDVDFADLFEEGGYYTTSDFRVEGNKVIFKGSDRKEYSVPKHWVVFETKYPIPFEMWDKQRVEEEADERKISS